VFRKKVPAVRDTRQRDVMTEEVSGTLILREKQTNLRTEYSKRTVTTEKEYDILSLKTKFKIGKN
jgi:hypothetical protein